jgi:hypothetical protein
VDNKKENYYIQITLDGLFKVDEDQRKIVSERLSKLLSAILITDGIISSKSDINVISEFEVMFSSQSNTDIN